MGYFYTDGCSKAFDERKIERDDVQEGSSIVRKLCLGHNDGIIIDQHESMYWIKGLKMNPDDFERVYVFSHFNVLRFRFHSGKSHLIEQINNALEQMKKDGSIQKIIDNYVE